MGPMMRIIYTLTKRTTKPEKPEESLKMFNTINFDFSL